MKASKLISVLFLSGLLMACSDDDSTGSSVVDANSTAINKASAALSSIATVAGVASSGVELMAGTANSECTATGESKDNGGTAMDRTTDAGYQGALGYCQATFNSVSPDTVRGSMAIAGGLVCEAARAGAFAGVNSPGDTTTVNGATANFDTTCWGSADDVAALTADMGTGTIPGINFTVTEVSGTTAYSFRIDYAIPALTITESIHVYNSGTESAALSSQGWAFQMDSSTGIIRFEGIDSSNNRRNRLITQGTISSTGAYSAVTSISGFQTQSGDLMTYNGTLAGLQGSYFSGVSPDRADECFIQITGSPDCSATSVLAGANDGAATSLSGSLATRASNLVAFTGTRLSFSAIDLTDFDLTD